ncbi:MAG: hypothetical protein NPIRA05_04970 [Nitrospirales bacterium]|nr:MAG: hypothetical protein NPIRA05_04970 [Nitrospirales bacterium]
MNETVLEVMTPAALVTDKEEIAFCNLAFQQKFGVSPGQPLMKEIVRHFRKSVQAFESSPQQEREKQDVESIGPRVRTSQYHLTYLNGGRVNSGGLWLLTVTEVGKVQDVFRRCMEGKHLSPREIDVATLVREGFSDKYIADELCISSYTVNQHLKRIHAKLKTHARAQLVSRLNSIWTKENT